MQHEQIKELYKKYASMVHRRCRYILKDEERAFDATQDIFVKLLIRKFNPRYFSSYLYRMATNHCINLLQRSGPVMLEHTELNLSGTGDNPEEFILDKLQLEVIFAAVPPLTRAIAVMRYLHKMKFAEIAELVGMSIPGIRKRLQGLRTRALALKEKMPS